MNIVKCLGVSLLLLLISVSGYSQNNNQFKPVPSEDQPVRYFIDISQKSFSYAGDEFDFKSYLIKKALKNEIELHKCKYNPNEENSGKLEPINIFELKENLGVSGNQSESNTLNVDDISIMGFWEKWYIRESDLKFTKHVQMYDFIRVSTDKDSNVDERIVFGIKQNDTVINNNKQFLGKKTYEVYMGAAPLEYVLNAEKEEKECWLAGNSIFNGNNPEWTYEVYVNFVNLLFERIKTGEIDLYDFSDSRLITYAEVKNRMNIVSKINDPIDPETTVSIEPDIIPQEIKSIIFTEKWYFDTESLNLEKEVISIIPVRYYIDIKSGENIKEPVFEIKY